MNKFVVSVVAACLVGACNSPEDTDHSQVQDIHELAVKLAQETLIVDTHIDVPYRLEEKWENVSLSTDGGDFDLPRAKEGGLNAPFMSIYTPADKGTGQDAFSHAENAIDLVEKIVDQSAGGFMIATTMHEVVEAFKNDIVALPLGMENGSPIGDDLAKLDHFYKRGVRYITLAHSKANQIADSSYDENRPNGGLSDFGHAVVNRMNKLGIMVDVSHVSDRAFYDVMTVTQAPVIASHSSARHFTPGFERNMDDDMIRALAKNGGVIMINFGSSFITAAANKHDEDLELAYARHLKENDLQDSDTTKEAFRLSYLSENPYPFATLDDVLDHIDHIKNLVGAGHIGIGSDYDGVGDSLPVGLKDVSSYPSLITGLIERGYSENEIKQILSGNLLRVWREVEKHARLRQKESRS